MENEGLGTAFERWAVPERDLENNHPFSPETDPPETVEQRRATAQGILQSLHEQPFSKKLFRFMSLLVGIGGIGYTTMRETPSKAGEEMTEIEKSLKDSGVRYELKKILFEELLERNQVLSEVEARHGREAWSQEERLEYEQIPNLEGRFEYLHKDHPELIAAYRDPRTRIESYKGIIDLMGEEFRHSSLPRTFAQSCVDVAPEVFAQLASKDAGDLYKQFSEDLMRTRGIRLVRELAQKLSKTLPDGHPVVEQIQKDGWMGTEVAQWLKPSEKNSMLFDQLSGEIRVFHRSRGRNILLDVFPGNGGPPNGVAWERGMPAHVAVRTPDGNYAFDRVFEKKSPSWPMSWVADTAQLRWAQEGENVDYLDQDGKWRRLTGEDAEFVVYGAPQKPFQEKERSSLYKAASQQKRDGSMKYPIPFTAQDALGANGLLRNIWDMNEFGPQSIRITDQEGQIMSIYFHSNPNDEDPQVFLDYSHGCVHMKPDDLTSLAGYLKRGSKIRVSSFEEIIATAQFEKPGTSSGPTGG